jgi:hypothetical protein
MFSLEICVVFLSACSSSVQITHFSVHTLVVVLCIFVNPPSHFLCWPQLKQLVYTDVGVAE